MADCPRIGKLIGGCIFRPRYDTVSGTADPMVLIFRDSKVQPARSTYIADVCERCGKTLVRRKTGGAA